MTPAVAAFAASVSFCAAPVWCSRAWGPPAPAPLGSPLFTRVTLNLPNGKSFAISAPNNDARNVYIQSAALNGRPFDAPVITYAQIEAGGRLDFVMGPKPSTRAAEWRPQPVQ